MRTVEITSMMARAARDRTNRPPWRRGEKTGAILPLSFIDYEMCSGLAAQ